MKIQCDVCEKAEAAVLCTADEAALCTACDGFVHHANKLAFKHQRFSFLSTPSTHHSPLCDICQERRALLFCQQDRAILCRVCDLSIHMANEHTMKHTRFLLTGIKLSASSTVNTASASVSASASASASVSPVSQISNPKFQPFNKRPISSGGYANIASYPAVNANFGLGVEDVDSWLTSKGSGSTSNMSDCLIETLPRWREDELLEASAPFGLCKDNEFGTPTAYSSGLPEIWVPDVRQRPNYSQFYSQLVGTTETNESSDINSGKSWRRDGFTVPQINPQSLGKRSRTKR